VNALARRLRGIGRILRAAHARCEGGRRRLTGIFQVLFPPSRRWPAACMARLRRLTEVRWQTTKRRVRRQILPIGAAGGGPIARRALDVARIWRAAGARFFPAPG